MLKHQKSSDRYQSDKSSKFMEYISKEMGQGRSASYYDKGRSRTNSKIFANGSKIKPNQSYNGSQIFSQPQIIKQRRGASILRTNSKTKYGDSMAKFRKDFIKQTSFNFYDNYKEADMKQTKEQSGNKRIKSSKQQSTPVAVMGQIFQDEELPPQQIHYQMVKMQQNVKLMQKKL